MNIIGYEAQCQKCGETFCPADAGDLEHLETVHGEPCGGAGVLVGAWGTITAAEMRMRLNAVWN